MQTEPLPRPDPDADEKPDYEPVKLLRTLSWVFLPPAFASFSYAILLFFAGPATGAAIFFSVLAVLALLFSPERGYMDWYGLCFTTAGVGLIAIGHPLTYLLGGVVLFFAALTAFDEHVGLKPKRKLLLLGTYALTAGLTACVYLISAWATLGLALLYLFLHVMFRLLPLGLLARAVVMEDDDS